MTQTDSKQAAIDNQSVAALADGMRGACITPNDAAYNDAQSVASARLSIKYRICTSPWYSFGT